jgi:hypothetical protein
MVTISDLQYSTRDSRRASVRNNAALAFAHAGRFDEAEELAKEAVTIQENIRPALPGGVLNVLPQILQMKQAAAKQ